MKKPRLVLADAAIADILEHTGGENRGQTGLSLILLSCKIGERPVCPQIPPKITKDWGSRDRRDSSYFGGQNEK